MKEISFILLLQTSRYKVAIEQIKSKKRNEHFTSQEFFVIDKRQIRNNDMLF